MSFNRETLYNLLPAVYRLRDADRGEPLKALLTVIAEQVEVLEEDLAQLYDDLFIETCASWVVPYIGDLVGDRALHNLSGQIGNSRALVANVLAYRKRKGTATALEQLARDATGGWPARVVEFFQLLKTTQYMNHTRLFNLSTPDLRQWQPLEYLDSPFETSAHFADVRRITRQRGRYNIPNIGIFLWRLQAYPVFRSTARPVTSPPDGRYWFHPVGLDAPLFNSPQTETEITQLAQPINVPESLRRRVLYEELEAQRRDTVNDRPVTAVYFGKNPVIQVVLDNLDDQATPIPALEVLVCNLEDWRRPPAALSYVPAPPPDLPPDLPPGQSPDPISLPIRVAIDPHLGRLTVPEGTVPTSVEVSYSYGFSANMGGGPYDRSSSLFPLPDRPVTWQKGVTQTAAANDPDLLPTLAAAIDLWNTQPANSFGIITLLDSHTYAAELAAAFPTIQIPEGSQLWLVAADWKPVETETGLEQRIVGQFSPSAVRPHLLGNLTVEGTASGSSASPGGLVLNGLLIEGALTVLAGNLGDLQLVHCTLVPANSGCRVEAENSFLTLRIDHSICGTMSLPNSVPRLNIANSIIDGRNEAELDDEEENVTEPVAIVASGTDTDILESTILGSTAIRTIEASNSIFTGTVTAVRRQIGCVRFSSLPLASRVPRRYRCQPTLALEERARALNLPSSDELSVAEQTAIQLRVKPLFTALRYGDPAYGQLSQRCAPEIRQGADDEAEMGAFHDLYQPQRETNLRVRLDEYLRFGLEAGIFYVT